MYAMVLNKTRIRVKKLELKGVADGRINLEFHCNSGRWTDFSVTVLPRRQLPGVLLESDRPGDIRRCAGYYLVYVRSGGL